MGHLCEPVLVICIANKRENDYVSNGEEGQNER